MAIAQQDTYAYDLEKTGHLFAIINYIDPNAKEEKYECLLCNDVIYENEVYKLSFLDEAKQFITNLSKEGYYIILGFLFLLSVSIFSIRERFQLS